MSSGPEELIRHVNGIQYLEYPGVGWMKAELLSDEALGRHAFSKARMALPALLHRLRESPGDVALHREVISFFLAEWICYQTPESSCAWGWSEDVSRYQPVSRPTAQQLIDDIIASSAAASQRWLDSADSVEEKSRMEAEYDIDYAKLADVFTNELFSGSQSYLYARTSPVKGKKRESWMRRFFGRQADVKSRQAVPSSRSVIGISDLAIGMCWTE